MKDEVQAVRKDIKKSDNKILLGQAESAKDRAKIKQLETRVTKIEKKLNLAA